MYRIFIVYLVVINLAGFFSMAIDKRKAMNQQWRIPEKTLFGIAILGGALGSVLGMQTFRHKIKHWYFVVGMPLILVLWIVGLFYFGVIR